MSREVGVRELRDNASSLIEAVEHGETLTVTRYGKPVARVIPAGLSPGLERLLAEGRATWTGRKPKLPPRPTPLRGEGPLASDYVSEGRD